MLKGLRIGAVEQFRKCMAERRRLGRDTHPYLTVSARRYLWLARGVPAMQWAALERIAEEREKR